MIFVKVFVVRVVAVGGFPYYFPAYGTAVPDSSGNFVCNVRSTRQFIQSALSLSLYPPPPHPLPLSCSLALSLSLLRLTPANLLPSAADPCRLAPAPD